MKLACIRSIGCPTADPVENMRRAERNAFNVVRTALIELADHPMHDEVGLTRMRQRYANARDNWASALRTLDQLKWSAVVHAMNAPGATR